MGSERLVVDDDNAASRHATQVKLIFAIILVVVLGATVWLTR